MAKKSMVTDSSERMRTRFAQRGTSLTLDGWVAFRLYREDCCRGASSWLWTVAQSELSGQE